MEQRGVPASSVHGGGVTASSGDGIFFGAGAGTGAVRERGQEDEERKEVQRIVRKLEAEEGKDDRTPQRQARGPQVHSLASSFQDHLILLLLLASASASAFGGARVGFFFFSIWWLIDKNQAV